MTTLATEYNFTATIKAKGEQGNAWKLEFDWKLPGSKFPFILYGREQADIENWNVGDRPEVVITRGALKDGRDGRYSTDYFYDLVSLDDTESAGYEGRPAPPPKPAPSSPIAAPETGAPARIPPDIPPNPAALGACQNHAVDFIVAGIIPHPEGLEDLVSFIWELRDRFYRNINQQPLAPLHFCYQHKTERKQSQKNPGVWGHVLPDKTACVETPPVTTGS